MRADTDEFLAEIRAIASTATDRVVALRQIADRLRSAGNYRWVGLYDVDQAAGLVKNIVWSGPEAPSFPVFPLTKGLTGSAISFRKTVNVGDVAADPRYLTALGSTRSEIIVPVFDQTGKVVGTIDVESEYENAFDPETQFFLERCSDVVRPLWLT